MRLDAGQVWAAAGVMEATPWGDIEGGLESFEAALRLAMEATTGDFRFWMEHAEAAGHDDEFSIEPWRVESMSAQMRRGYIAALLRAAALSYGFDTEFGDQFGVVRRSSRDALGPLLHDLTEIAAHRSVQELHPALNDLGQALQHAAEAPVRRQGWYLVKAEQDAEAVLAHIRDLRRQRSTKHERS